MSRQEKEKKDRKPGSQRKEPKRQPIIQKQPDIRQQKKRYSSTPYDDVFRTLMEKGGNLRIPFLNEMFHPEKSIPPDARIDNISNEYYIGQGKGRQKKIITDSVLSISGSTYHVECQSTEDGTILMRVLEYDSNIAAGQSRYENHQLTARFPYSGVLFLRRAPKVPDRMTMLLVTPEGSVSDPVETVRLSDYTLQDLVEKNLLLLLPFYTFNLEVYFEEFEYGDPEAQDRVLTEFQNMLESLNHFFTEQKIKVDKYLLLTEMIRKVADHLARKYEHVREELNESMGGKVLKFRGEDIFNRGKAEGEARGEASGKVMELVNLAYDGLLDPEIAADRAEQKYHIEREVFRRMLREYNPEEEEDLLQG